MDKLEMRDKLVKLTEEEGVSFLHSFDTSKTITIGTVFSSNGRDWIVGRIDSVTVVEGYIHVTGACITDTKLFMEMIDKE